MSDTTLHDGEFRQNFAYITIDTCCEMFHVLHKKRRVTRKNKPDKTVAEVQRCCYGNAELMKNCFMGEVL